MMMTVSSSRHDAYDRNDFVPTQSPCTRSRTSCERVLYSNLGDRSAWYDTRRDGAKTMTVDQRRLSDCQCVLTETDPSIHQSIT